MMGAAVPQLFLKDPPLTKIAVPACIALVICLSVDLEAWCWGFHVSGNRDVGFFRRWSPTTLHFMIYEGGSSDRLGELSCGEWGYMSPLYFLNLL